jgi:predicted GNAT superfamily acetyltransferase
MVSPTILKTLATHGGTLFGAISPSQQLVGYVFGFPAIGKNRFLYFHSHQLGVLPAHQNKNIGTALKTAQYEYCEKIGIPVITWTYDPLTSVNSQVNFSKMHVIGRTYRADYYGERNDIYNIDLPTDRLEVELWLTPSLEESLKKLKKNIKDKYGKTETSQLWAFPTNPLPALEKIKVETRDEPVFIPVPGDFLQVKKNDIEILKQWRLVVRQVYERLIAKSYVAVEFWRSVTPSNPSTMIWVPADDIETLPEKFIEV